MNIPQVFAEQGDVITSVLKLLKCLNISYTYTNLKLKLEEHPDYPSLLSISEVLREYGVVNYVMKTNVSTLLTIRSPFIVQSGSTSISGYTFSVVREMDAGYVTCYDTDKGNWVRIHLDDFAAVWTGIVLVVTSKENAIEKGYNENQKVERRRNIFILAGAVFFPLLTLVSGIAVIFQDGRPALFPLTFLVLSLIGAIVSTMLLMLELGNFNVALKKFCRSNNCGSVHTSAGNGVAGVSWSALGIAYFTGTAAFMLTNGVTGKLSLLIVSLLSLAASAFTIYSFYYQWRVLKKWCSLCVSVQVILLLQAFIAMSDEWLSGAGVSDIPPTLLISLSVNYALSFFLVVVVRVLLKTEKEAAQYKVAFKQLKLNEAVFEVLSSGQKAVTENTQGLGILLGNPQAANRLIKVCNPYCGPCAEIHPEIEHLVRQYPDDLQVQIIFTATDNDKAALPVRHFMALSELADKTLLNRALDEWYSAKEKDYRLFSTRFPVTPDLPEHGDKLKDMREWCTKMDIRYTPTIFFNGRQLPPSYQVGDLKYLLSA